MGFRYSNINFDEPKPWANDQATMYIIIIAFLTLTWICVAVRLFVRFRIVRSAGWDDLFVGLGVFCATLSSISSLVAIQYGLGQHFLKLEELQWGGYLIMFYVGNATYVGATTFIKLALLLQFLRSFEGNVPMRRIIMTVASVTALWGLAYSILAWFPCSPVHKFWYGDLVAGKCWGFGSPDPGPFVATFVSQSSINMALDMLVLLIPVPLYFSYDTTSSDRMRLLALLCMGCTVLGIAAWRLATLVEHKAATYPTRDPTWYGPISIILSIIEVDLACICASIPIFWPMMEQKWNRIFVTQEFNVTSEERYGDDQDGLTNPGGHSRSGSDCEQGISSHLALDHNGKEGHYRDSYVLRQIDPTSAMGTDRNVTSKTEVMHNRTSSGKWMRI